MTVDRIRRRVIVYGRVQGVFFRGSARERAEARGVTGWVCNRPDGTLEAVLEGERDAVNGVIGFLRTGPPRARVEDIEVRDETPQGLSEFIVR